MLSRRGIAHLLLAIAGLLIAVYPITIGANPSLTCRGVQLQPGQTCAKADGSATQTYEDRASDARRATPVLVGIGLLVAGFGGALLVADVRRARLVRTG